MEGTDGLCEADKKRLLDMSQGLDRIVFLLLFETHLDLEDLIKLRVSDVDIESGFLRTSPDRKIKLSELAHSEIKEYLKSRPGQVYLLEGRCAKPITIKWRRCRLENLLQRSRKI